jgi:hypothetical protein
LIAHCAVALAGWDYREDEDPLDDTAIAVMTATEGGNPFGMAWKCWKGGETQMRLITPLPFGDGSQWQDTVMAEVRVDKTEKFMMNLHAAELSGQLSFVAATSSELFAESDVADLLRQLTSAKQRLVIGLNTQIIQFKAGKAAPVVKRFAKRCGLDLAPPPSEDETEAPEIPKI